MEQYKELYQKCFPDSQGHIDYFFSQRVSNNIECIKVGEKVVSELFYFDRELSYFDRKLAASFISGACTDPEHRKQGHMFQLLKTALLNMRKRGITVAYLYPYSHSFYRKSDFITFTKMEKCTYLCDRVEAELKDMRTVSKIYKTYLKEKNGYTIRNTKDFEGIFLEIAADNGRFYLLKNNGKVIGYNYYDSFNEQNELVTLDKSIFIESGYTCLKQSEFGEEYSMARCVDVVALLEAAEIKQDFSIRVVDYLIESNNGCFSVSKKGVQPCEKASITLTISQLTEQVLGAVESPFFERRKNINLEKY